MIVRPLGDHVVIKVAEPDKKIGSILIPETSKSNEKVSHGKVIAVGPGSRSRDGERRLPMSVKEGDHVLFGWGGNDVEVGDNKYRIMTEGDILAILD